MSYMIEVYSFVLKAFAFPYSEISLIGSYWCWYYYAITH